MDRPSVRWDTIGGPAVTRWCHMSGPACHDIHNGDMRDGVRWPGLGQGESGDVEIMLAIVSPSQIWLYFKLPAGIMQRLQITNKCNVLCMQTRDGGTRATWQHHWPIRAQGEESGTNHRSGNIGEKFGSLWHARGHAEQMKITLSMLTKSFNGR